MTNFYVEMHPEHNDMTVWIEVAGEYYPFSYDAEFDDRRELEMTARMVAADPYGFGSSTELPPRAMPLVFTETVQ